MAVLECSCGSMVESNMCCNKAMDVKTPEMLGCSKCGKEVMINRCCGKTMKEKKMDKKAKK